MGGWTEERQAASERCLHQSIHVNIPQLESRTEQKKRDQLPLTAAVCMYDRTLKRVVVKKM